MPMPKASAQSNIAVPKPVGSTTGGYQPAQEIAPAIGAKDIGVGSELAPAAEPELVGGEPIVRRGQGIMVEAVQEGFYQGDRKEPGAKFEIRDERRLGSWMKCLDPEKQKAHEDSQKKKIEEARKAAQSQGIVIPAHMIRGF